MFLKFLKVAVLLFLVKGEILKAQTLDNPWLISVGVNGITVVSDFRGSLNDGMAYSINDFEKLSFPGFQISVNRTIFKRISLGSQFSFSNNISKKAGGNIQYLNLSGLLKYRLLKEGKISPYAKGGWGVTSYKVLNPVSTIGGSKTPYYNSTFFGGAGFDIKIGGKFNAFAETSLQIAKPYSYNTDYLQYAVGISYLPKNKKKDIDGDGVLNEDDKCPEIPGLKEFFGCLDTDGDGVADNEDDCPEIPGSKELKGCLDTDGDGVLDNEDDCPKEEGSIENNGCPWPDTDGDGVADKDDKCPDEAGDLDNQGCLSAIEEEDENEIESNETAINNEEIPINEETTISKLNRVGKNILFPANSYKLLGRQALDAVEEVKRTLDSNSNIKIIIEGYASTDGGKEYGIELSQKRAEAVMRKLIEMGVDETRIEVKSYGDSNIVGDESTIRGRGLNRRVEFKIKE